MRHTETTSNTRRNSAMRLWMCAGIAAAACSVALGQVVPDDAPTQTPAASPARESRFIAPDRHSDLPDSWRPWVSRLEALSPGDPETYLLLGEEVLDRAGDEDERRLAIDLLVRAFDLARAHDAGSPIATSACLALVDARSVRADRQKLRSLAGALAPRRNDAQRTTTLNVESPEYLTSTGLTLTRTGMGFHAKSVFRKPEAAELLESMDGLLQRFGIASGADGVAREIRRWPCPVCSNQRIVKTRDGRAALCPHCDGEPGPKLSPGELLSYLRAEFWLVRDSKQPWSLQMLLDDGLPAQLVDPTIVARMFRVDSSRAYFRQSAWHSNPDGTDATETAQQSELAPMPAATSTAPPGDTRSDPNQPSTTPAAAPTTTPTTQPGTTPPGPTLPIPTIPIPKQPKPLPGQEPLPGEEPYPLGPQ